MITLNVYFTTREDNQFSFFSIKFKYYYLHDLVTKDYKQLTYFNIIQLLT